MYGEHPLGGVIDETDLSTE